MTRYLLDTDVIAHLAREPAGALATRLRRMPSSSLCTSLIVAAEIHFGLARTGSEKLARHVLLTLEAFPILPFESPADRIYGEIRALLERNDAPLGTNDMLIAAHALALGTVVATGNARQFSRIPELRVENWLADTQTRR